MDGGLVALLFVSVFLLGPPLLVGIAVGWFARGRKEQAATGLALHEASRLDALVEQIRHDAYEHMTLDSRLAPIIVDTIRSSDLERQRFVGASGAQAQPRPPEASWPTGGPVAGPGMPAPPYPSGPGRPEGDQSGGRG